MSASEIADNKWEAEAAKPPVNNLPAYAQILLIGSLAAFFGYLIIFSAIGAFSAKKTSTLEKKLGSMNQSEAQKAASE